MDFKREEFIERVNCWTFLVKKPDIKHKSYPYSKALIFEQFYTRCG